MPSFTDYLAAAGSGGVQGAGIGSAAGPWGTAIGALLGAGLGAGGAYLGGDQTHDALYGAGARQGQINRFNPQQMTFQRDALSAAQKNLGDFSPIENAARRDFESKTLPSIAERFTSQFGDGAQRSSGFGQILGSAGADLESRLAEMRKNYFGDLANIGMQQQFEPYRIPADQSGGIAQNTLAQLPQILKLLQNIDWSQWGGGNQQMGQQYQDYVNSGPNEDLMAQIAALRNLFGTQGAY